MALFLPLAWMALGSAIRPTSVWAVAVWHSHPNWHRWRISLVVALVASTFTSVSVAASLWQQVRRQQDFLAFLGTSSRQLHCLPLDLNSVCCGTSPLVVHTLAYFGSCFVCSSPWQRLQWHFACRGSVGGSSVCVFVLIHRLHIFRLSSHFILCVRGARVEKHGLQLLNPLV